MAYYLELFVSHQLQLVVFAGVVWSLGLISWCARRPALMHGLWLLVLLKFVTPPLVVYPVLPLNVAPRVAANHVPADTVATEMSVRSRLDLPQAGGPTVASALAPALSQQASAVAVDRPSVRGGVASFWNGLAVVCAGCVLVSGWFSLVALLRCRTLWRVICRCGSASDRERQLLLDVCQRIGVAGSTAPRLLIVEASVSPFLWSGFRDAAIVLPRQLVASLSDEQLRHILAHELAHFRRRDYLVRRLSFLVTTLFWWNPVSWLARRQVHTAAEASCDALAIQRLAGSRKSYAQTLMAVFDYVSSGTSCHALVAASFAESRFLQRRIQMIANARVQSGFSYGGWLLLLGAAIVLPLNAAQSQEEPKPSPPKAPAAAAVIEPSANSDQAPATRLDGNKRPAASRGQLRVDPPEEELKKIIDGQKRQEQYTLPDYLPAAHGNMVEVMPNHFFQLAPMGSPRVWHIIYYPNGKAKGGWDAVLTIPAQEDLQQGQTVELHQDAETKVIAYVENDYANDLDIGVKIVDAKTGETKYKCTLLMNAARYNWVIGKSTPSIHFGQD